MKKIAICIIAYNRLDSLKQLLTSIEKAEFKGENIPLIISIDKSDTSVVEEYANNYDWKHGHKKIKIHERNLGLRNHIISQGEEFQDYDALIILEDDVIVSPAFYQYAMQTVEFYFNNAMIAGISLYSFPINYLTERPFEPLNNGYDAYFMQTAQSWGQIWMKEQWNKFYIWYLDNESFDENPKIPNALYGWKKSWLKYHTRYCIEKNKYFVYPYFAFSSNGGGAGIHSSSSYNNYETNMQCQIHRPLLLPEIEQGVHYDAFFENIDLKNYLLKKYPNIILDLNGYKNSFIGYNYAVSSKNLNFKIEAQYGLSRHPIEMNIFESTKGNDIYIYNLKKKNNNLSHSFPLSLILYQFRIRNLIIFLRKIGLKNMAIKFLFSLIRKFGI